MDVASKTIDKVRFDPKLPVIASDVFCTKNNLAVLEMRTKTGPVSIRKVSDEKRDANEAGCKCETCKHRKHGHGQECRQALWMNAKKLSGK